MFQIITKSRDEHKPARFRTIALSTFALVAVNKHRLTEHICLLYCDYK